MNAATALSILIATLLAGAALGGLAVWNWAPPRKRLQPLPTQWNLAARRALNTNERRFYNQLRLAFPKFIVLPKLPLVRLCQPATPEHVTYWYELIGSAHVTFAVCNPNGHVLLVIDLDSARSHSRRSTRIKESVLATCGIRRLQFAADALPSVDELRAALAGAGTVDAPIGATTPSSVDDPVKATEAAPDPAIPATALAPVTEVAAQQPLAPAAAPTSLAITAHRTEPAANGQDPNVFLDSFFTTDDRPGVESAGESAPEWTDWPSAAGSRHHDDGAVATDEEADARWRRAPVRLASGR
ncbi:MAG: DUF2726 domain-containing protein [Burkholderiaceae bacterium]|nr:DUF2726 domain-containing protein [Burkholderiaceae bacterium]